MDNVTERQNKRGNNKLMRNVTHGIIESMPTPKIHTDRAERQRAYRQRQKGAREIELAAKGLPVTPSIPTMPGTARWEALIKSARTALDASRYDMEAYFDARSENWRESERGEALQEQINELESIIGQIDDLIDDGIER